jgi:hypothetical protein
MEKMKGIWKNGKKEKYRVNKKLYKWIPGKYR